MRTVNDNSLVVTIAFAGRTILFAGDIETEGEDALVAAGLPHADVVKVPHHGSPTSSTPAVRRRDPPGARRDLVRRRERVRVSVARRRRALARAGAEVARTDLDGAIEVTISPSGTLAVTRFAR